MSKSKKWFLTSCVTVSAHTYVVAETLEDAIRVAKERPVELYFNGSGAAPDYAWCVEEADGEPFDVRGDETDE
jgi:hypothetical protein